jgi:hypothetical protein
MTYLVEERAPTKSSEILLKLFGKKPSDFGELARTLTELQTPTTQGQNAYSLSKYIVEKGEKSPNYPNYERAIFFKKQYESNLCYICGTEIIKKKEPKTTEELEHVLPIGEALALTGIIQEGKKEFSKNVIENIADKPQALSYLLEYARSHRCCNQLKSVTSFLSFNGNPPYNRLYKVDYNAISSLLKEIWKQTIENGKLFQEPGGCNNKFLIQNINNVFKDRNTFIDKRSDYIIKNYIKPILDYINDFIDKSGSGKFAQLVFLANQVVSISPKVWEKMGAKWGGDIIEATDKQDFFIEILTTVNFTYKNTMNIVLKQVEKIYNENENKEGKQRIFQYYESKRSSESRKIRKIDMTTLISYLNEDFLKLKKKHKMFLNARKLSIFNNLDETYQKRDKFGEKKDINGNYGFFGIEYMYFLLLSQDDSFRFYKSMKEPLQKMMININNYTILYIYFFIIFGYPTDLTELNDFSNIYLQNMGYGEIHEDMVMQKFQEFNYVFSVELQDKELYTNIQQLNDYTNIIVKSPLEYDIAESLIESSKTQSDLQKLADIAEVKSASDELVNLKQSEQEESETKRFKRNNDMDTTNGGKRNKTMKKKLMKTKTMNKTMNKTMKKTMNKKMNKTMNKTKTMKKTMKIKQ